MILWTVRDVVAVVRVWWCSAEASLDGEGEPRAADGKQKLLVLCQGPRSFHGNNNNHKRAEDQ